MNLATLHPLTIRLLLASCAAHPASPLDVRQKTFVWWRLGQRDWLPTWDMSPVPLETVNAWYDDLRGVVREFVEGIIAAEHATNGVR